MTTIQESGHEIPINYGGYSMNRPGKTGVRHGLVVIGVFEILLGISSVACSIPAVIITVMLCHELVTETQYPYNYFYCGTSYVSLSLAAPGFWTGLFAILTGAFAVILGSVRSAKLARVSGAFSFLLILFIIAMISIEFLYVYGFPIANYNFYFIDEFYGLHYSLLSFGFLLFVFAIVTSVLSFVMLGNKCCCCCYPDSRTVPLVIPMVNQAFTEGPQSVNRNNLITAASSNYQNQNISFPNALTEREHTMFSESRNVPSSSAVQVAFERQRNTVLPGDTFNTDLMKQRSNLQSQQQYRPTQHESFKMYPNIQEQDSGHLVPPASTPLTIRYSAHLPPIQPASLPQTAIESTLTTVQNDGYQQLAMSQQDPPLLSRQATNLTQPIDEPVAIYREDIPATTDSHQPVAEILDAVQGEQNC